MTPKEVAFVKSLQYKIIKYEIKTTLKEALTKASGKIATTRYNNQVLEKIDTGIEYFLCARSPLYFMDHYGFIQLPNVGVIPFVPYYFQAELLKEINDLKTLVYLKTRQCGISTLMSLYCLWRSIFRSSENIDIISTKKEKAQDFVSKMKLTLNEMPPFLKPIITSENKTRIVFMNGSQITSEPATDNAGRGDTLSFVVLDEAAFYRTDALTRKIISSVVSTLSKTGGGLALVSTPNGCSGNGSYYYEQVTQRLITGNTATEKLIEVNWYEVPDVERILPHKGYNKILEQFIAKDYYHKESVRKEMKAYFAKIEEKFIDNPWLNSQHTKLGDAIFRQEVFHDFVVMGTSVFSSDKLNEMQGLVQEPILKDSLPNGRLNIPGLWIWKNAEKDKRYIVGVDISTGTGKDPSSIQVFCPITCEQVAEYKGYIATVDFPHPIREIAKYYNNALVVVECNSIGEAVFNGLYYDEKEPYYNMLKNKLTKNGVQRWTGWLTDSKTRPLITNEFIDWINVKERWSAIKLYSSRLKTEMATWVWTAGGRADHVEGGHDDSIMAMALCLYHRNAVDSDANSSFFIVEDGTVLEKRGSGEEDEEGLIKDVFEYSSRADVFKKKYNITEEEYKWLLQ